MNKTPEEIEHDRQWIEAEYEVMGWELDWQEGFLFKPSNPPRL